jgi:hypothetical protein
MNERGRGPWYLIFGLALGLAAGLLIAWVISPVRYVENGPNSLKGEFKDQYRAMIALAFQANGDLGRAQARLDLLEDANSAQRLASQAQQVLAEDGNSGAVGEQVRAMALLAAALSSPSVNATGSIPPATPTGQAIAQVASPTLPVFSPTPSLTATLTSTLPSPSPTPTSTRTPTPSVTPIDFPTPTSTPTPLAPFKLSSIEPVCQAGSTEGLLQVQVTGADGKPIPGVRLTITWTGGENTFFTGLKPAAGPGYADFLMQAGQTYTLKAGEGGELVRELQPEPCAPEPGQAEFPGGLLVIFTQPG